MSQSMHSHLTPILEWPWDWVDLPELVEGDAGVSDLPLLVLRYLDLLALTQPLPRPPPPDGLTAELHLGSHLDSEENQSK